jgi:spore maturation protein CgeB
MKRLVLLDSQDEFTPPRASLAPEPLRIVVLGLSITSSWGNGHATTYRGLVRELCARGHDVLFLERNVEWYASNRDLPRPPYGVTRLYRSLPELKRRFTDPIVKADLVIIGSYVPEGAKIGEWLTRTATGLVAFYDIDTPVTLARLAQADLDYLSRKLIPRYDLYLSFTGGPTLELLEKRYGSPAARALYCSVDPGIYFPENRARKWDLGYMGTYSDDRQPTLERLLIEPARTWTAGQFAVAGPQYPRATRWPHNVKRFNHLPPGKHRRFYNSQRFTLNVTRADMIAAGYSPSVRLFEAAACGTPIISDYWDGIGTFLKPGKEILIARSSKEAIEYLRELPETERDRLAARARARVLEHHTAAHRAVELESHVQQLLSHRAAA